MRSQLPSSAWHQWLNEPTIADAIMDRLLHGSHTIALKGESLDLRDEKGRRVIVPAGALGYVDLGEPSRGRVGFGA